MWNMVISSEILKTNANIDYQKPVIGYIPDWREKKDENGNKQLYYLNELQKMMKKFIESQGGQMYIFDYNTPMQEIENKIDGLLIPGGRDLNPIFYGQQSSGSNLEEDSLLRYPYLKNLYETINPKIPIFAICWGFQFLNVVHGGTLNQHILDSSKHFTLRRMKIRKNNWFYDQIGESMIGQCYHHQGIDKLGKNLDICILDDYSNEPHGFQIKDSNRWVKAVLWHPEATFMDEMGQLHDRMNQKLLEGFVDACKAFKISKKNKQFALKL